MEKDINKYMTHREDENSCSYLEKFLKPYGKKK